MEMEKKRCGDEDVVSLLLLHKQEVYCLIQEILVWLPVVSLLRFKAVCKFWRELIESPFFIDLHTTTTTTTILNSSSSNKNKFGSFIVLANKYYPIPDSFSTKYHSEEDTLVMLSSPSYDDDDDDESEYGGGGGGGGGGSNDQEEEEEEEGPVVVRDDLGYYMHGKEIVGSCNGLVCIHNRQTGSQSRIDYKPDEVSLWNPATGQGMDLPESIIIPGGIFSLVVFGFDVETKDDYKVVKFTSLKPRLNGNGPEFCFFQVQVYSLSSNSWRLLNHIPCLPGYPFQIKQSVVYLNGTCFFLAHYFYTERYPCLAENDRFIISFDFTKEIITPIQLPDHHREQELFLCSLGDNNNNKIALFTSPDPNYIFEDHHPSCEDINVWVLNYERGSSSSSSSLNKESWKKFHSFQLQVESGGTWYTPSGISNDGKFALLTSQCDKSIIVYNFATKQVKKNFPSNGIVLSNTHAYKPSLVSLIGGNDAREEEEEEQQQQQQPIW